MQPITGDAPARSDVPATRTEGPLPKTFRINRSDLVEHGFAEGSTQCERNEVFSKSKDGLSHSTACRARLLEAFMTDPKGHARFEAYEERVDRALKERKDTDLYTTRHDATAGNHGLQPRPDGFNDRATPGVIPR